LRRSEWFSSPVEARELFLAGGFTDLGEPFNRQRSHGLSWFWRMTSNSRSSKDHQVTPTYREALMNTKLKFAFEKETKGAVRYQEVGEDGAPAFAPQVGTLYIRKSAMPGGKIPKTLIVTIAGEQT
jgi:hypothetical protein